MMSINFTTIILILLSLYRKCDADDGYSNTTEEGKYFYERLKYNVQETLDDLEADVEYLSDLNYFDMNSHQYVRFTATSQMVGMISNINMIVYEKLLEEGYEPDKTLMALAPYRPKEICYQEPIDCDPDYKYRTVDGTCNNMQNPHWGAAYSQFTRVLPAAYADGYNEPKGGYESHLPNPRLISHTLHYDHIEEQDEITNMVGLFGQYVDHDMTITPDGDHKCCDPSNFDHLDCYPIEIPQDDEYYSQLPTPRTCMDFSRSTSYCFPTKSGKREQMNMNTAYLDLSQVYGGDKHRADHLREFNGGRMRTYSKDSNFLPLVSEIEEAYNETISFKGDYLAGDFRVNEMPSLTTLHTTFMRAHNQMSYEIAAMDHTFDDEKIYQETKRLMTAMYQHIIYTEYLPAILGHKSMKAYNISMKDYGHTSYNPKMDATIGNEFATGAYRFGHTLMNGIMRLYNGQIEMGSYSLRDHFFNSYQITQPNGFDYILGGMIYQKGQKADNSISEDLRSFVLRERKVEYGDDLAARNIQRARDHGLQGYNAYRKYCGLSSMDDWKERPPQLREELWDSMKTMYEHPNDIDIFAGGMMEYRVEDGMSGPTFNCLKSEQFHKLMYGDRHFYSHNDQSGSFTKAQLDNIKKMTFGDIICRNSNIHSTPRNVFRTVSETNPWVECKGRPHLDMNLFYGKEAEAQKIVTQPKNPFKNIRHNKKKYMFGRAQSQTPKTNLGGKDKKPMSMKYLKRMYKM